ncbi:hypothetical protein Pmar_PMAR012760, partial [Perkinsus marinus ATCC 50983]
SSILPSPMMVARAHTVLSIFSLLSLTCGAVKTYGVDQVAPKDLGLTYNNCDFSISSSVPNSMGTVHEASAVDLDTSRQSYERRLDTISKDYIDHQRMLDSDMTRGLNE